ncbi:hypothetical protein TNCV_132131 [Trichonephila clavipes]|nr:hypothetical protein TNCV_132131 [Trichonephila clavipes]
MYVDVEQKKNWDEILTIVTFAYNTAKTNPQVGSHTTHHDGEVKVIHLALLHLFARLSPPDKVVILSDTNFALQDFVSNLEKQSSRVQNCMKVLSRIQTKVAF